MRRNEPIWRAADKEPAQNDETQDAEGTAAAKIGVVLTTSGLGDNNFNDMVYAGLEKAKEDLGITFDYAEPSSPDEYTTMTYNFAQDGSYDLIIVLSTDGAHRSRRDRPPVPGSEVHSGGQRFRQPQRVQHSEKRR